MAAHQIRSVPVEDWPEPDRCAWEAACRPGGRLARGGAAAHLKPITRADLARRYGYFLDHLHRPDADLPGERGRGHESREAGTDHRDVRVDLAPRRRRGPAQRAFPAGRRRWADVQGSVR